MFIIIPILILFVNSLGLALKMNISKSISIKQQELLMEMHERSILKQAPVSTYYMRYGKGLLTRGLIELSSFVKDGRTLSSLIITDQGIEYLQRNL